MAKPCTAASRGLGRCPGGDVGRCGDCERLRTARGVSVIPVVEHQDETRAAYDGVVELYASLFADRLETQPFARAMIGTFAELLRGTGNLRAADVGCGPGHLTAMLHDLGLDAFGLDLSPAMIEHARRALPALRFDEARMEALPVEDGTLGGVLAHYSMIHTPPEELHALLDEQARVLAPGACSWSRSSPPTDRSRSASTTR